jgi:biotin carboxyl carrier protein
MSKKDHSSRKNPSKKFPDSHAFPPEPEKPCMEELEIGGARYLTRFTRKFNDRKIWHRSDPGKMLAFIPGTVQKILVQEGMEVRPGDPLFILEAMKMRNELLSPVQGMVKKIHVSEGDKIPKGHLLLEFTRT